MVTGYEKLLFGIKDLTKKYDSIYQKTGGYFNIFEIASIATKELMICRVISELLSPKGSHCQGTIYLSLFFSIVLKIDFSEEEIKSAKVFREYVIDEKRRIDLVIQMKKILIPIEVKIYAKDQKKQCFDYYKKAENAKVYYLTPFGNEPKEYSAKGLISKAHADNQIQCLSFSKDIIEWLDACLIQKETIKLAPIREIILQLSGVIRRFTNQMEDEKEGEVVDIILESKEMFESALAIESALPAAKSQIMMDFFEALKMEFENHSMPVFGYSGKDIEYYYKTVKTGNPRLSILIKKFSEDIKATFSIQIQDNLYYSFEFQNSNNDILKITTVQDKYKNEYDLFVKAVDSVEKEDNILISQGIDEKTFFWGFINNMEDEIFNFKSFSLPCVNLIDKKHEEAKRIFDIYSVKISEIRRNLL